MLGFHILDVFFVILGCYFVIRGCFRGFVGEIISLAGFICSFYLSFRFSDKLGGLLGKTTGINAYFAQILAVIVVWLVITTLTALLRRTMRALLRSMCLGSIDTILGVASGLLKITGVVYAFLIAGLLLAPIVNPTWMTNSDLLRYAGRHWPSVREELIKSKMLAHASELPDGTLEAILRPYRTGSDSPEGYKGKKGGN